jgi:16S rRNA (guanine(966)-N(2))-methyltransferase RsmD
MTRVIAGARKGFKLATLNSPFVRPTTDRVKQVIFNVLTPVISDSSALDIFSGTGGLGIEALSRGARSVVFVEYNDKVCAALIANLRKTGFLERSEVIQLEAKRALKLLARRGVQFDLIFADPPYEAVDAEATLASVAEHDLLKTHGWLALEHSSRKEFVNQAGALILRTRKIHGDTAISFYQHE